MCGLPSGQVGVDLACDVALEAADDLALAQAFGGPACDIVASWLVMSHPDDSDDVEGAVCRSITAAAEPVAPGGAATAGGLWGHPAELGECGLVPNPFGVVAGGDQELSGDLSSDAMQLNQCRCGRFDHGLDLAVESLDLFIERFPAAREVAQ